MTAAGPARTRWLDRFRSGHGPVAIVATELLDDVVAAVSGAPVPERLSDSACSVALLRAAQGRSAVSLVEDVLSMRTAVWNSTSSGLSDPAALLLAHQRLAAVLDGVLQDAIEAFVAETQAALSARATRDQLTGLLNRAAFDEALAHECAAADRHDPPALLLLDLDGFKGVNDTLGHPVGDDVLVTVAALLRRAVRRGDVVSRLGGDEFAVLMPRTDAAKALDRAERLVATARRSRALALPEAPAPVGFSIGVARLSEPEPEALYAAADAAMYEAKRAGKGRARLHRQAAVHA